MLDQGKNPSSAPAKAQNKVANVVYSPNDVVVIVQLLEKHDLSEGSLHTALGNVASSPCKLLAQQIWSCDQGCDWVTCASVLTAGGGVLL